VHVKKTGPEARKKTVLAVKIFLRKLHTRLGRTAENGSRNVLLPFTADQLASSMQDISARFSKNLMTNNKIFLPFKIAQLSL
jgi:hypothetical protein